MSMEDLEHLTGKAWGAFTNAAADAAKPALNAGATAVVGLGALTGAAGLDANSNPALAVEEGECLPTKQMSQELQAHNMKPFMNGDFVKIIRGGDTPHDTSDDEYKLNMAMLTATPNGKDVWLLRGDTPKGKSSSSEFCVEAKAHNLRIVYNSGDINAMNQSIPYRQDLVHPKAGGICSLLSDSQDAPDGVDYFLNKTCAPFDEVTKNNSEGDYQVRAQMASTEELKPDEKNTVVYTIFKDDTETDGFMITKSFAPWGLTHTPYRGYKMETSQYWSRLEK